MEYDLIGELDVMNLPNKLTVLRVIMVPFFVLFHADRYAEVPANTYGSHWSFLS